MLARFALLALLLPVAATASANPLVGVWGSDLDLTLLKTGKSATLMLEQREVLSTPVLFDQLAAIYADREIEFRLAEAITHLSYRTVATGSDFVGVEYDDRGPAEPVHTRLLLHGGLLYEPAEEMGFDDVFRGIDAPAALAP